MRRRRAVGILAALAALPLACSDSSNDGAPALASDAGARPDDGRPPPPPATIVTIAGRNSAEPGFADGDALGAARFDAPEGLVLDATGQRLYVADSNNHAIRRLDLATMTVTTVAGVGYRGSNDTADGVPARLSAPRNLVLDPSGTGIYFTDTGNFVIRRLDLSSLAVTTVFGKAGAAGTADGAGASARFSRPSTPWGGGMVIDAKTDPMRPLLYVADSANQTIRSIDLATREVKTIAGQALVAGAADGTGLAAKFNKPSGLVLDGAGKLYVTEANNLDIRQIDLVSHRVVTVAGKAPADPNHFCENISPVQPPECGALDAPAGLDARFRFPFGVARDPRGGFYVVDSHNNVIRYFDIATTAVTTVAGVQMPVLDDIPHPSDESTATQHGTFWHPSHAVLQAPNVLLVADRSANCLRRVELDAR